MLHVASYLYTIMPLSLVTCSAVLFTTFIVALPMSVPLLHSSGTNDEKSMSHPTIATDLWPMDHLSNLQNENLMTANQESKSESHLDDPNYFEGDLDIPHGMIDVYYNNSYEKHEKRRFSKAIRRDKDMLWPQGIIYYSFHSSINSITQNVILEAIHEIGWLLE